MPKKIILFSLILLGSPAVFAQETVPAPVDRFTIQADSVPVKPSPPADQRLISDGVLNGKALTLPKPAYPSAARQIRVSGAVSVQVLIDEKGDVISAAAVSGHPLLRAAAVEAAKGAKFSPTKLEGVPVKVSGIITYNFVGAASVEKVVLGIGFDLADGEITGSFYPGQVRSEIPVSWAEERALLDKIFEGIKKYAVENPPKPDVSKAPPAKDQETQNAAAAPSVNQPPPNFRIKLAGANEYSILSASDAGSGASRFPGGKFGEDTLADLVEFQAVITRRFAENEVGLWYFRYGQSLARLKANVKDDAKAGAAINELQVLRGNIPAGSVDVLGPQIDRVITLAEAARTDSTKRSELIDLIGTLRGR